MLGIAPAANNLGIMYEKEEGIPQDCKQAECYYIKALELGYKPASSNLNHVR